MKSRDYWKKRSEAVANRQFKKTDDYILVLQLEYQEALNSIQKDIEVFYARFAQNNEITLADARQLLNSNQLKEFKMDLKEFTRKAKNNKNQQWEKELNNVSYKVRVTRLQALQTQIRNQIENLYSRQQDNTTSLLSNVYKDTYYRNIFEVHKGLGIGVNFAKLDTNTIDKVITEPWQGANYSSRIWNNKDKLIMELQTNLTQAFIRGDSIDKTSKIIAERMEVSRNRARTLVNTESAHITSKATFDSYSRSGVVKQYEILATLDLHTSKICRSMDGKVFNLSEKEIGVNAPPFHPNCRTTTIAYFDDVINEERIARNSDGNNYYVDENINYGQWYDKYVINDYTNKSDLKDFIRNLFNKSNSKNEVILLNDLPKMYTDNIGEIVSNSPSQFQQLFLKYADNIRFLDIEWKNGAKYSPKHNAIYINLKEDRLNIKGKGAYTTFFHELGHLVDKNMGRPSTNSKLSEKFRNAIINDTNSFILNIRDNYDIRSEKELCKFISKQLKDKKEYHSISDIFGGVTGNKIVGNFCHKDTYWQKAGALEKETFAHFFEATIRNDKIKLDMFKNILPNAYEIFIKLLEEV